MDHRAKPRWPTNLSVRVTDLQQRERSGPAPVIDIAEQGMCVCLPFPLEPGAYVSVEVEDSVFFAFVAYSNPGELSSFRTGLEIVQVLLGTSSIANTVRSVVLDSAWPGKVG